MSGVRIDMCKKEIKIFMVHPEVRNAEDLVKAIKVRNQDGRKFKLIWDDKNPNYLIGSEHIYNSQSAFDKFLELYSKATISVFWGGECVAPDLNIFDYAIAFNRPYNAGDRVCRIPTRLYYKNLIRTRVNECQYDLDRCREELASKKEFCNFIYSNANGHPTREALFHKISEYKHVDSLGNFLNNKPGLSTEYGKKGWWDAIKESINLKSQYKFSIASENACFSGYTSEKLFSSLEAHTVPIYFGNPLITEEVNPKAIINCNDYNNLDEVLERVKEIDRNDDLWIDMVSQPWLTDEQLTKEKNEEEKYDAFLDNIFMQDIKSAQRKGEGFHQDNYRKWFFKSWIRNEADAIFGYQKLNATEKDVIVFGAGNNCKKTISVLKHIGKNVITVFDNNEQKWGYKLFGEIICEAPRYYENNIPVIVSIQNRSVAEKVVIQLKKLGYKRIINPDFVELFKEVETFS